MEGVNLDFGEVDVHDLVGGDVGLAARFQRRGLSGVPRDRSGARIAHPVLGAKEQDLAVAEVARQQYLWVRGLRH